MSTNNPYARQGLPPVALRASDEERERVAEELRQHCEAGRITLEEFEERVTTAYEARTRAEIDALMADLPRPVGAPHTAARSRVPGFIHRCCCCW
ncbi:MAG: DUF1707 SHOCT-like domain-containing protein [Candidatus Dormibacteria bacterium]